MCNVMFCIDFMFLIMQIWIFHVFDHADRKPGACGARKQKLSVASVRAEVEGSSGEVG
jgi:hypothetical protein